MSTRQITSNHKRCATCDYYSGNRLPFANWVKYEIGNGYCGRPPFCSPAHTTADSGCSYWKKWGALR
ncbi:MAG: hypothetical protein ACI4RN_01560 [Oscillospiraceae bacterium]